MGEHADEPTRHSAPAHCVITPTILYFGTPVVLISTCNADGSANLAPMSSAWALGQTIMLGLGAAGKTAENLARTGECVLNLPSDDLWQAVEQLAPLTGKNPVPEYKLASGFHYEPDKFGAARLTTLPFAPLSRTRQPLALLDDSSLPQRWANPSSAGQVACAYGTLCVHAGIRLWERWCEPVRQPSLSGTVSRRLRRLRSSVDHGLADGHEG